MKDVILDESFDLLIKDGDYVIGESLTQDVALNLSLTQGNLKSYPLIGPNLKQKMKGSGTNQKLSIMKAVKQSLELDNKDYNSMKKAVQISIDAKG